MKAMVTLAIAVLFKNTYKLEPGTSAVLTSTILFPWSIKIVYGLISDNYPIFGAKRKPYLIAMSFISAFSISFITFYQGSNYHLVTAILTIQNTADAFNSCVIEAILVQQSRKYPEVGSAELTSFAWSVLSVGGIIGSVAAAIIT